MSKYIFVILLMISCSPSGERASTNIEAPDATPPSPSPNPPGIGVLPEGTLSIESTPTNAEVWVNNVQQGVTPILTSAPLRLAAGNYAIKITKSGFVDVFENITLVSGQHIALSKVLTAKPNRASAPKRIVLESASGASSEFFAYSATSANLDGDKYSDLIVSAKTGKVYIFYGKNLQGKAGQTLTTAIADKVILGSPLTAVYAGKFFDSSKDDVLLAVPSDPNNLGSVYVFKADNITSSSARDISLFSAAHHLKGDVATRNSSGTITPAFGSAVAFADLNGDGQNELLIAAKHAKKSSGEENAGRVYIYELTGFSNKFVEGRGAFSFLGDEMVNIGDIDSDQKEDIAMGANVLTPLGTPKRIIAGFKGSTLMSGSIDWQNIPFLFSLDFNQNITPRINPLKNAISYHIWIYFGGGLIQAANPNITISSNNTYSAVTGSDYDGDGMQDIVLKTMVLPNPYPSLYVVWGKSSGFGNSISVPPAIEHKEIAYPDTNTFCSKVLNADISGNGISDFIFVSPDKNYSTTSIAPQGSGRIYIYWFE